MTTARASVRREADLSPALVAQDLFWESVVTARQPWPNDRPGIFGDSYGDETSEVSQESQEA